MKHNQRPRILIVDDSPTNIQVLAEALKLDYQIKIATSGAAALQIAAGDEPPDLILLDVMMPEMDGYEVCRRLKAQPQLQKIPVIFVTAKQEMEEEEQGLNLGAVDYITKPFHLPIIKARIRNHLELKRKSDLLESLAKLDGLTNIPNRRALEEVLIQEWQRACRNHTPLAVIMLDIDSFKAYNDHYGHCAGDLCLKAVAGALQRQLSRAADTLARYGGEEFTVVLPETDFGGAQDVAERLRAAIDALAIEHAHSDASPHVTISVGFASTSHPSGKEFTTLLESTDKMLYQAKATGRNRVCGIDLG